MEDILIYLMEFSSLSQIYVKILLPTLGFQKKLHTPLKMLFIFDTPPSECAEFWSPPCSLLPLSMEELIPYSAVSYSRANFKRSDYSYHMMY